MFRTTIVEIVRKALSWPARQIAINAGEDGSIIVGEVAEKFRAFFLQADGKWRSRSRAAFALENQIEAFVADYVIGEVYRRENRA